MKSTDFELTIERDRKGYYVATVLSLLEVEGDEALEDGALVQAMEEVEGSPLASRDEVFKILDEPL